ncbi:MAG: FKBP-type peptidyl-prolyl cis-trans isomerase [Propionibacteriales bacterium]|nr:FKBP-type peptidyl-prolyl cis-trans isomerase [Propionibacteriales bacterium]
MKEPKVELKKKPWAIDKTRVKVLSPGTGATVPPAGPVEMHYYGVNGRTGKKFDDSFSRGQTATFALDRVVPGFQKGLAGQKAGSRVLVAMPGEDGYDKQGGSQQAGIEVGDSLIFVIDIVATTLEQPEGDKQKVAADLPTVSDDLKNPKITVPTTDPPTELKSATVIKGKGAKVAATDAVTVNYRGVLWSGGTVIDENYGSKTGPETAAPTELIAGFGEGLADQTVGSRVLIVIPPDKAYGPDGNEAMKIPADATLVYVVDILFTQPTQAPQ